VEVAWDRDGGDFLCGSCFVLWERVRAVRVMVVMLLILDCYAMLDWTGLDWTVLYCNDVLKL
jgi:hypothetical protein